MAGLKKLATSDGPTAPSVGLEAHVLTFAKNFDFRAIAALHSSKSEAGETQKRENEDSQC